MIVGFEPGQEMNLVPIGTNEFFPQLVHLVANERHRQSHPYSHQKLGRRNQAECPLSSSFPEVVGLDFAFGETIC